MLFLSALVYHYLNDFFSLVKLNKQKECMEKAQKLYKYNQELEK